MVKKIHIRFGHFCIKAVEAGRLNYKQIEAGRRAIKKKIKPLKGIIQVKLKRIIPITQKALSVRMGRGKGKVKSYIYPIYAGEILYEIYCPHSEKIKEFCAQAMYKLSIKAKMESR